MLLSISASLCLLAMPAAAGAPPPASQLHADCRVYTTAPDSLDGRRCLAYVQGYVDGFVAAGRPVSQTAATQVETKETFSERAMRTRLRKRDRNPPRADSAVCIADSVPTAEVVTQVVAHLDAKPPAAGDAAAVAVYAALLARFPCTPAP
ncbi:MAG: Rap1a/Tai family immunity protein [Steroidobacteraceae bacterium]